MAGAGYELLDHVADMGILAWGPDEPAAFAEAVRALGDLLGGQGGVRAAEARSVCVLEPEPEAALVALLQEVLLALELDGWLAGGAALAARADGALAGCLLGEPFDPARHGEGLAVKAVTWHGLSVVRSKDRVEVRVVLDV